MATHYRKIQVGIANDRKVRELSDDAELAFYRMLTHPHLTAVGAMRGTVPGLAAEWRWPERRMRAAMDELERAGMLVIDPLAACLWFPKFARHNAPESPNVVKAWAKALGMIPECAIREQAARSCAQSLVGSKQAFREAFAEALVKEFEEAFVEVLAEAFGEAFMEAFAKDFAQILPQALLNGWLKPSRKSMPYQEQEQEQEQEQDSGNHSVGLSTAVGKTKAGNAEELAIVISMLRELSLESSALAAKQILAKCRTSVNVEISEICAELRKTCARMPRNVENPTGWVISQVGKAFTSELVEAERLLRAAEESQMLANR